jgi:hypothetical protein
VEISVLPNPNPVQFRRSGTTADEGKIVLFVRQSHNLLLSMNLHVSYQDVSAYSLENLVFLDTPYIST